jgi:hypothetical protein
VNLLGAITDSVKEEVGCATRTRDGCAGSDAVDATPASPVLAEAPFAALDASRTRRTLRAEGGAWRSKRPFENPSWRSFNIESSASYPAERSEDISSEWKLVKNFTGFLRNLCRRPRPRNRQLDGSCVQQARPVR